MEKRYKIALLITAVIVAGTIRFLSSANNLRLDEIWSINIANEMHSPLDAFRATHDNNHILNTIYLYYFGDGNWWPQYRFISLIAGTASVALLGWLGFQISTFAGISTLLFSTLSTPLIVISSEARGYAPSIFFAIVAFAIFKNYGKRIRLKWVGLFWFAIIFGLLSQLIFVYIYAAFLITSLFIRSADPTPMGRFKEFLLWHSIPTIFTLSLYFYFVKNLVYGGGITVTSWLERFTLFMITALNLPYGHTLSTVAASIIFVALLIWIIIYNKRSSADWVFYGIVVGIVPTVAFFVSLPFYNPIYLSFSLPFIYLLLASLLSRLSTSGKTKFVTAVAALLIFIVLSVITVRQQIKFGPGQYLAMFQYAADNSRDQTVSLVSGHDFRYKTLIDYYKPYITSDKQIIYISNLDKNKIAEWLIVTNFDPSDDPPPSVLTYREQNYDLKKIFPNANVYQGWSSFLYQLRNIIQ